MFLDELICHEGWCASGLPSNVCIYCKKHDRVYHCEDCFLNELYCAECIVKLHALSSFHHVKQWNGVFFMQILLKSLELHIQLGHTASQSCIRLVPACINDNFFVINTNSVHEVSLDFCGSCLYPVTVCDPRTAATFRVLQQFHILSFESKASTYEYYSALDCYEEFVHIIRKWHNLKLLMHSGHAYDPAGLDGTATGQCTVLCPACLQPGKNIPVDFLKVLLPQSWIYTLFHRNVSADAVDPNLNGGSAFFVEENAFKTYLLLHAADPQEKSTCSGHTAVNLVSSKKSHGLAATGVGTVDCAHHNMKLPTTVRNLQKGEKYTNMDYLFFSAIRHFPSLAHFHLPIHKETYQLNYSFNFIPCVEHMDGEALERGWANINPAASSTKEMGPGFQRDILDDFFGDWNWKKTIGLSDSLLTKMKEAVMQKHQQHTALQELEAPLPPGREANQEVLNPYHCKREGPFVVVTQAKIHLELAKEEAKLLQINVLQCKIESWTSYQILYMPLGLDALEEIQQNLHLHSYLLQFKQANIWGQGANTCVQNTLNTMRDRIKSSVSKYCATHAALISLSPAVEKTGWNAVICELQDDDVHALTAGLDGQTEGQCTLSWIWQTLEVSENQNKDLQDEVILLLEEIHHVKEFFDWKAHCHQVQDACMQAGFAAYCS
ncbi:hypothetical protein HD554DRAFT_2207029 [Boletus coccyginus]|nr:hypothetical protein HD554DRAFT_2207029 [Boletus coccyginus]